MCNIRPVSLATTSGSGLSTDSGNIGQPEQNI